MNCLICNLEILSPDEIFKLDNEDKLRWRVEKSTFNLINDDI